MKIESRPMPSKGKRDSEIAQILRTIRPKTNDCVAVETLSRAMSFRCQATKLRMKVSQRQINGKIYIWRTK